MEDNQLTVHKSDARNVNRCDACLSCSALPRKNGGERSNSSADWKKAIINNNYFIELVFPVRIREYCHSNFPSLIKDNASEE